MSRNPRILLLHASVGSGHTRAALALEAALRELYPDARIQCLDALELANPLFRKIYGEGYLRLADRAPNLLGALYEALDRPAGNLHWADSLRSLITGASLRELRGFLSEQSWDLIAHTHFLSAEIVAHLRRRGKLRTPHVIVTTDFDSHRLWAHLPCEHFFVPTMEGAASLRQWGAASEDISLTGIPIHPDFSRPANRGRCLKAHGLRGDKPILLQLAGGFGTGPIEEIYRGVIQIRTPCEIVVIAGRNERARRRLLQAPVPARHHSHVFGYTDKMQEFLSVADIVISKPGGLTSSECLALGVPMAVVQPIPGQESRNADFLLENGAAIKINGLGTLSDKLQGLLSKRDRLAQMSENAARLGKPLAAFDVASKMLGMIRERRVDQLLNLNDFLSARKTDIALTPASTAHTSSH